MPKKHPCEADSPRQIKSLSLQLRGFWCACYVYYMHVQGVTGDSISSCLDVWQFMGIGSSNPECSSAQIHRVFTRSYKYIVLPLLM